MIHTPRGDQPHTRLRLRPVFGAAAALAICLVSAAGAEPAPQDGAIERYRAVLMQDVERSVAGVQALQARVAAQDLAGARQAWLEARIGWERSEVYTSGFVPELDRSIDAWPDGTTGFHAIEARLFGAGQTDVADATAALLKDLTALRTEVKSSPLTAQGLYTGLTRLAYEIGESKVDGGESRISGTSLDDMRNNLAGIDAAWRALFAAALETSEPALAADIARRIAALDVMLREPELRRINPDRLRTTSEELVLALQGAAPRLTLQRPTLD